MSTNIPPLVTSPGSQTTSSFMVEEPALKSNKTGRVKLARNPSVSHIKRIFSAENLGVNQSNQIVPLVNKAQFIPNKEELSEAAQKIAGKIEAVTTERGRSASMSVRPVKRSSKEKESESTNNALSIATIRGSLLEAFPEGESIDPHKRMTSFERGSGGYKKVCEEVEKSAPHAASNPLFGKDTKKVQEKIHEQAKKISQMEKEEAEKVFSLGKEKGAVTEAEIEEKKKIIPLPEAKKLLAPLFNILTPFSSFDEKRAQQAADALKNCILSYRKTEIIEAVKEASEAAIAAKYEERLHVVLSLVLQYSKDTGRFVRDYFRATMENPSDFAAVAIKELSELEKKRKEKILPIILPLLTVFDLEKEDPKTLFRNTTLSTSLYREYGRQSLKAELHDLETLTKDLLAKENLSSFCIHPNVVEKSLRKEFPNYDKFLDEEKQGMIQPRLEKNASHFVEFAPKILDKIYEKLDLSKKERIKKAGGFEEALIGRRAEIAKYTMMHPEITKSSRIYVSEILFLRIVNPVFTNMAATVDPHSEEYRVLMQLPKVIQNIANEEESSEAGFAKVNSLAKSYQDKHNQLVDRITKISK